MVKVITIEREYGSQGAEFAYHLSNRLGWKLVDRCLVDEIAQKAGVPKKMAQNCDERLDPWYYRVGKAFWHGSVERLPAPPVDQVFDSDRMVKFVRDYFGECATAGRCVIVGRGAACALLGIPGVFNIFVYASSVRKMRWFEQNFPEHAADAAKELEATDRRRQAYIERYYGQDWTDHHLYHMMINSCMGFDAMVNATLDGTGLAALYDMPAAGRR